MNENRSEHNEDSVDAGSGSISPAQDVGLQQHVEQIRGEIAQLASSQQLLMDVFTQFLQVQKEASSSSPKSSVKALRSGLQYSRKLMVYIIQFTSCKATY